MCIRDRTYDVLGRSESFFKKVNVHIIQCDEEVQSDVKITCAEDLETYMENLTPVSYTHLDVYKRQVMSSSLIGNCSIREEPVNRIFPFCANVFSTLYLAIFSDCSISRSPPMMQQSQVPDRKSVV